MASSTLNSVTGNPFKTGSELGFLSFAGAAAAAKTDGCEGNSAPKVKIQAKETKIERMDRAA